MPTADIRRDFVHIRIDSLRVRDQRASPVASKAKFSDTSLPKLSPAWPVPMPKAVRSMLALPVTWRGARRR